MMMIQTLHFTNNETEDIPYGGVSIYYISILEEAVNDGIIVAHSHHMLSHVLELPPNI